MGLEFNLALLPYNPCQVTAELQSSLLSIQKGQSLGHKELKVRKAAGTRATTSFADAEIAVLVSAFSPIQFTFKARLPKA